MRSRVSFVRRPFGYNFFADSRRATDTWRFYSAIFTRESDDDRRNLALSISSLLTSMLIGEDKALISQGESTFFKCLGDHRYPYRKEKRDPPCASCNDHCPFPGKTEDDRESQSHNYPVPDREDIKMGEQCPYRNAQVTSTN